VAAERASGVKMMGMMEVGAPIVRMGGVLASSGIVGASACLYYLSLAPRKIHEMAHNHPRKALHDSSA